MSSSSTTDPASAALLQAAQAGSSAEEQRCHVLLDLIETCDGVGRMLRRELARKELTESGFRLLALVARRGPAAVTPAEVAGALGLPRPAVSTLLGRLEVSGLIVRERTRDDRRTFAIGFTVRGRRVFAAALARYREIVAHVMSGLDSSALGTLAHTCTRLRQLSTSS